VEAPHITRQVQRLAQAGYAERPTPATAGSSSPGSPYPASRQADPPNRYEIHAWCPGLSAPGDLHQLTIPFHRMVDEFLTYTAEYCFAQPG